MEKLFSCIILLAIAALCVPGCFAEESTAVDGGNTTMVNETEPDAAVEEIVNETGSPAINTTYTADINVTALTMNVTETVSIALKENPTTGYSWNVTNSTGLEIVNDTYVMDAFKEGMVGVGGTHEWTAKAVLPGNQTFTAVMMHVADIPTGEEETYTLAIVVEDKASESVEEKPADKV